MATLTVKELAGELGTDARTARKFLRSITDKEEHPGKGARWSIEKREVRSLRKKFNDFHAAQSKRKQDASPTPVDEDAMIEDESIDAPTDEELMMIDEEMIIDE